MSLRSVAVMAVVSLAACPSAASDLYVDASSKGSPASGTPAAPYRSLSRAIAAAPSGATIRIAAGTYRGAWVLSKSVTLRGAPTTSGKAGKAGTVLSGRGNAPVLSLLDAGKVLLQDLVIRGGAGKRIGADVHGGGIYIRGGSTTLRRCRVINNHTRASARGKGLQIGGGVFLFKGSLTIEESVIRGNSAHRGGGIGLVAGGTVLLRRNLIAANVGRGDHGGGIYGDARDIRLIENRIRDNRIGFTLGYGYGGGVNLIGKRTRARFLRNIVSGNAAASLGSGYFIDDQAQAIIEGDLLRANRCAPEGATAILVDGLSPRLVGSRVTIERSTIVDHRCPAGARGGHGINASERSTVKVRRSVLANNGKRPVTHDKGSTIDIRASLLDAKVPGRRLVFGKPRFVAPERGDYRLAAAVGGIKPGIDWRPVVDAKVAP